MPLPPGRGGLSNNHGLHGQGQGQMLSHGYGRHHNPGGQTDGSGNSQRHSDENQIYFRGNASGLASMTEEEIMNAVGGLELVAEQEPDLAEYAAAAARGTAQLSDNSSEPSRVLVIQNVARNVSDQELSDIFKAFGDTQGLHTASKQLGLVVVAYFDLRAAISAQNTLQGTLINKAAIDVQFIQVSRSAGGRPVNQGQVVVYNLDPDTSNDQLVWLFSKFGDVQGIKQSQARPSQKLISYFDVRHAAAAMRAMNRAEHLNKIPSYVTPQQMANLQTVTSGPNLMQLAQLQGIDPATAAAAAAAASGGSHPGGGNGAWEGLGASGGMEGLLQLVNQQQQAQQNGVAGMMQGDHHSGSSHPAFNRLGLDSLAANARGLPLSDSASSIASVPNNLLLPGGKGLPGQMPRVPHPSNRNMLNDNHAAMFAADRHAAQQQLQLMQASEAASMLMGLNLNGYDKGQWGSQDGQGGMPDPSGAGGLWPGGAGGNGAGAPGFLGNNLNQFAALQELQLRQQQAFQAAGAGGMGQLSAAANLQAAAQILQAAGLGQFGPGSYMSNPYNAASAAQILQQAGLGLGALGGLNLGSMSGGGSGVGMQHSGGGRGNGGNMGADGANSRNGGRLSRRTTDPVAEAERKAQQEKLYALDLEKIARGEDKRTTLMIKNIPNKYTQKMLLGTIDESFRGSYDFFYLPIDFKNKCNVGYAFINLIQPINIIPIVQRFNHKKWERFNSEKVCNISYARIQGRAALVQHFQNSSLMHEDKRCRPILFTLEDSGDVAGEQEPFPPSATSGPASLAGGGAGSSLDHGSGGSATKLSALSGLAGSTNSLRSMGGSTNSLRELAHRHSMQQ